MPDAGRCTDCAPRPGCDGCLGGRSSRDRPGRRAPERVAAAGGIRCAAMAAMVAWRRECVGIHGARVSSALISSVRSRAVPGRHHERLAGRERETGGRRRGGRCTEEEVAGRRGKVLHHRSSLPSRIGVSERNKNLPTIASSAQGEIGESSKVSVRRRSQARRRPHRHAGGAESKRQDAADSPGSSSATHSSSSARSACQAA